MHPIEREKNTRESVHPRPTREQMTVRVSEGDKCVGRRMETINIAPHVDVIRSSLCCRLSHSDYVVDLEELNVHGNTVPRAADDPVQ
jgi:hypothetical protein